MPENNNKNGILTSQSLKDKNLVDQDGVQIVNLFLYIITNHKDKGLIKENTVSFCHIRQVQNIGSSRNESIKSLVQINKANASKGNTALLQPRESENNYSTEEHINNTEYVIIATKDKELTLVNGVPEQEVFFVDGISPNYLKGVKQHGKKGLLNPTAFILTPVKDITDNYTALMFLYTFNDAIVDPKGINLEMNNYTLLSKIMAIGKVEGKKHQDIDLKIDTAKSSKLSLLTMTPTSTNYKVSNFSHWLDANRTLPFVKAKIFLTKHNLKDLFSTTNKDFDNWTQSQIEEAYKVIIGMMKLTLAFTKKFSDYRDAEGKIKPDVKINDILVVGWADDVAQNAIDGLVETWKSNNPAQVDSPGFKIMTEVIAMLSQHIKSSYAIGGGTNDFNKVYLPWYFVPSTAITHTLGESDDFEVILRSEYFTLEEPEPLSMKKHYEDISAYVAHDLNGWISQPELPSQIVPINKFSRPVNVNTKSDEDLKYLFYIPYTSSKDLENLYGELTTSEKTGWYDKEGLTHFSKPDTIRHEADWLCDNHTSYKRPLPKPIVDCPNPPTYTESDCLALIKLSVGTRVKQGSITNIKTVITKSCYEETKSPYCAGSYGGVGYVKKIVEYKLEFDYQLEINGSQTITSIEHKGTIFDKLNWRSMCIGLTGGTDKYLLALKPNDKFNLKIESINELNIQAEWLDELSITIYGDNDSITFNDIELHSGDDETSTNLTILL